MKKFLKVFLSVWVAIIVLFSTACTHAPSTVEQEKAKMQNSGYFVSSQVYEEENSLGYTAILSCAKVSSQLTASMTAILFTNKTKATEYVKSMKKMEQELGRVAEDREVVGRWVLEGNKEAWEDFKK